MPRCDKYHSKWKANMAKCSKYHAKCKVNMPKCSKYCAKRQVLVPNCCKYKANGAGKESKKNPKPEAKKIQKLFYTPFSSLTLPTSPFPSYSVSLYCRKLILNSCASHDGLEALEWTYPYEHLLARSAVFERLNGVTLSDLDLLNVDKD